MLHAVISGDRYAVSTEGAEYTEDADDIQVIVFNYAGKLYALKDCCPHDGGILSNGLQDGDEIVCPRHGARFNIVSGLVTASPVTENLTIFEVRFKNNRIQIKLNN